MIICLILLFLLLSIRLLDLVVEFYTWQSRIHIGRWTDKEIWGRTMGSKSLQWLKKTPTIKLTDNNRLIIIDILKGNYKRNAIQHWQEAALLLGLIQSYKSTGDEKIKKQINDFVDSKIDASGNWRNVPKEIDGVILAYAILKVEWISPEINRPAFDAIWDLVKALIGEEGTVQYRKGMKDYRYVDTIGFICPFLIAYGTKFNNHQPSDLAIRQISEFNKYGMFSDTFIPCHTYHVHSKLPIGLFGWGRGLGWYAIGLIDAWNELPDSNSAKKEFTESVVSFAKMALQFQNESGSWNWIVSSKEAQSDSSATATLAWFLANASKIEEINTHCEAAKNKALIYLMKVTRRDGAVDFSQGDTKGIGIHSQHFDILPFTQGFCLRTLYYDNDLKTN